MRQATSTTSEAVVTTSLSLSLLKLMTGILLLDSYFVTPISIFNISMPIVIITAANCRYIDFCLNNTCLFLSLLQYGLSLLY